MPSRLDQLLHDARGPLNTISINAEVAKLLLQKSAPVADITATLQNIVRECQRCSEILQLIGNQCSNESGNGSGNESTAPASTP